MAIRNRYNYNDWYSTIGRIWVQFDFETQDEASFWAEIDIRSVGNLQLYGIRASAHSVIRTASHLLRGEVPMTLVTVMQSGTGRAVIDGKIFEFEPNDILILHSSRPFELHFPADMQCWVISVPAASLRSELLSFSSLMGLPIATEIGLGRIVLTLFEAIRIESQELHKMEQDQAAELLVQSLNMLAGSVISKQGLTSLKKRQFLLDQAALYIRENVRDPSLSARSVADALGISQRYLNKLFQAEPNSVAKLISATRLEGAKHDLCDPLKARKPITDIAFDWGFNSVSHFSRVYKQYFGSSPREQRHHSD